MNEETVKKPWSTPKLVIYGTVEEITADPKWKDYGSGDDFCCNLSAA